MSPESSNASDSSLRNISDTARWVAVYRARETERPDTVFRDPLAHKLAGDQGKEIAASMTFSQKHEWSFVARTYLIDKFINQEVQQGVDMVVNLAAGLDTRPYRMELPAALRWEVDLPDLLDYKEDILRNDRPICRLERIRLDLSRTDARRELFVRLSSEAKKILVLTEGLIIYLSAEEVASLAADLAGPPSFQRWILDLVSPGLLVMLQQGIGQQLDAAGAPLKFGPAEGPEFFLPFGWKVREVGSLLKTAASLGRLSLGMRLAAMLPASNGRQGTRPWSGICLLQRD